MARRNFVPACRRLPSITSRVPIAFPEAKPAVLSMIAGIVDELYAYSHHLKWLREEKEKQLERRARREVVLAAIVAVAAPGDVDWKETTQLE